MTTALQVDERRSMSVSILQVKALNRLREQVYLPDLAAKCGLGGSYWAAWKNMNDQFLAVAILDLGGGKSIFEFIYGAIDDCGAETCGFGHGKCNWMYRHVFK